MEYSARRGASQWAVTHERWVWLLFSLSFVAGVASYLELPVKRFPTVELPAVAVVMSASASAPVTLEKNVAIPVENALGRLPGIHKIWTQIVGGQSVTIAQFDSRLASEALTDHVRSALLPLHLGSGVSVRRLQIESEPMLSYAVTSVAEPTPLLSAYVDQVALPAIQAIPGVAEARRLGGSDQQLKVTLVPDAMRRNGVTPLAVTNKLERWSLDQERRTARSLADVSVGAANGVTVQLREISRIAEAPHISSAATLDGDPAIGVTVSKLPGADSLKVGAAVADVTAKLSTQRRDVGYTKIWSTADETAAALDTTKRALIEGMALAALVVLLFMRDIRATILVALAMPMSIGPTFLVLYALGFTLNVVTLLALTLAVGILVDDAIVEVENINRLVANGVPPPIAAPIGADRIALAVVATTLAIVAVFVPVSFMPGVGGRFFYEFGLTVSSAVTFSLLVARFLTPVLAARLLRYAPKDHPSPNGGAYERLLVRALTAPKTTIIAVLVIVAGGLAMVPLLPTEFQPTAEPDFYFVSVVAEPRAGLEGLQALVGRVAATVRGRPETKHVFVHLGATPQNGGAAAISLGPPILDPRSAVIAVATDPGRRASLKAIRNSLRLKFQRLRGGTAMAEPPSGTADIQILLAGEEMG